MAEEIVNELRSSMESRISDTLKSVSGETLKVLFDSSSGDIKNLVRNEFIRREELLRLSYLCGQYIYKEREKKYDAR
jgi:hypothetical protein